jgi:hypothetical protein
MLPCVTVPPEWAVNIIILLFGTTVRWCRPFIVPTPPWTRTVLVGDHLLVDKLSYAPSARFSRHLLPYTSSRSAATLSCSATPVGHQ